MESRTLLDHPSVLRLWRRITDPSDEITDVKARQRVKLVSALLAAYVLVVLISVVFSLLLGESPFVPLVGLISLFASYALSRSRHYKLGSIIALITLWFLPFVSLFFQDYLGVRPSLFLLEWLILALLFGMYILPIRGVLLYIVVTFIAVVVVGSARDLFHTDYVLFLFTFMTMLATLMIVVAILRREDQRQRQRVEESLREREERYRMLTQFMSDYAYSLIVEEDGQFRVEWVEGAWTAITGLGWDALPTLKWREMVEPEDYPIIDARGSALRSGKRDVREYRIRNTKGEIRWIRDYGSPVWSESEGRVIRILGGAQDITERKNAQLRAEEQRRAAEEQRRLAEALRDTAAILSSSLDQDEVLDRILNQVFLVISSQAVDIMLIEGGMAYVARARGFHGGREIDHLKSLRIPINQVASFREMTLTGKSVLVHDTLLDPEWVSFDFTGERWIRSYVGVPIILDGITMGFINATSSIPNSFDEHHAQQLRAFADQAAVAIRNALLFDEVRRYADALGMIVVERNNQLNFERERFSAILEASGDGILYTEDLQIKYANRAFAELTGYSVEELIDQNMIMLRAPHMTADQATKRLKDLPPLLRDGIWRGEIDMRRKDGGSFTAGMTISMLGNAGDGVVRTVSIIRDVTREKVLRQQQSQFVAHASHELRTPITNFKTRLHLLRRDPARLEDHIAVMEEVSDRMRRLVNDLLDLSRYERGEVPLRLEPVVLQAMVTRVANAQLAEAERKQIHFELDLPELPLIARIDEERMIQVITNLVTNAINYTPPGGEVYLSVALTSDAKAARIRVRDTGIGIAPEHLPLIFQPFYRVTSEVEGTGLGLSIARELIRQHGGRIDVVSQPGVGSIFDVIIPLIATGHLSDMPETTSTTA